MKLSPVTPALAADLAQIHAETFPTPWTLAEIVDLLDTPGVGGLLASMQGPAAMILWRAVFDEAEILTVATTQAMRRRGLARALVEAAALAARAAGAKTMFLEVAVDNIAAVELYRSLAFDQVGVRRGYYDRGAAGQVDALVMRRELNAG